MTPLTDLFGLDNQVAIVTGGTGVLGGAMARGLARAGARVGILGRRQTQADKVVAAMLEAHVGDGEIARLVRPRGRLVDCPRKCHRMILLLLSPAAE